MTAGAETRGRSWASAEGTAQSVPGQPQRERNVGRTSARGPFDRSDRLSPLTLLGIALLTGAALYLARPLLISIALAILLSFLVHPIVTVLSRALGRVTSVMLVVALLFSVLGGIAWGLTLQFGSLSEGIPRYRDNLIEKITAGRNLVRGGILERAQTAVSEVKHELEKEAPAPKPQETPTPVVIRSQTGLWQVPSLLEGLSSAAVVLVLVIFMLLEWEELRNRFLRLAGFTRLATATRALDEISQRISHYLLMQSVINTSLGLGVTVGLLALGIPYALLWGFLAAVLRFIPYVGAWLAAAILATFCLAAFPDWWHVLASIGLFAVLELVCAVVMEPLLYGHSAGVSQVALLISISFWTWLWGPAGLLLATPLTVCLVVLAKHVPELEFVTVLMADQPPLAPAATYYQRLVANDQDEAWDIVAAYLKNHPLAAVYDDVIVPALGYARRDRQRRRISAADERAIWDASRELVEEIGEDRGASHARPPSAVQASSPPVSLLLCPAHDDADQLALSMLTQLLDPTRWAIETASPDLLASEVLALVEATRPSVLCIGTGPSAAAVSQTRHLCKRLRARFPELKIVVGQWGLGEEQPEAVRRQLKRAGADFVCTSLAETRQQLELVHGLDPRPASPDAALNGVEVSEPRRS
jgi:predicted PurR-regulated permease PerM